MTGDGIGNRLEPALDAAVERVVVAALIMRLMRLAHDPHRRRAQSGKAAAAITPAIGHVGVDAQIVPAGGERLPVAQIALAHQRAHLRRPDKGKAVLLDRVGKLPQRLAHHPSHKTASAITRNAAASAPASTSEPTR